MSTKLPIKVSGSRAWSIHSAFNSRGVLMNTATSRMPATSDVEQEAGTPAQHGLAREEEHRPDTTSQPTWAELVQRPHLASHAFHTCANERCTAPMKKQRS